MPKRPTMELSRDEFEGLTTRDKIAYLDRLLADLKAQVEIESEQKERSSPASN